MTDFVDFNYSNSDDEIENNHNNMLIIREIILSNLVSGFLQRDSSYMIRILQEDMNNNTPVVFHMICNMLSDVIGGIVPESLYIPFIDSLTHPDIIKSICLHIDVVDFDSNELFKDKVVDSNTNADIYDITLIISFIQYEGFTKIIDTITEKKNSVDILNAIFRMSQNYDIPRFFTKKHLIYMFEKFVKNITTDFEDIFTRVNVSIHLEVEDVVKLATIYFSKGNHPNNTQKRFEFTKLLVNFNISEQDIQTGLNVYNSVKKDLGRNILNHIINNFL
jgi:hypothetical protein